MSINEELIFFNTLHNECQRRMNSSLGEESTVQELVIDKVQRAANQGIVSENAFDEVSSSLKNLKERTLTQLTPSEQDLLLNTLLRKSSSESHKKSRKR